MYVYERLLHTGYFLAKLVSVQPNLDVGVAGVSHVYRPVTGTSHKSCKTVNTTQAKIVRIRCMKC